MNRKSLFNTLKAGADLLNSSRLRRVLRRPIRILYPYLLEKFGARQPVLVDTFFGRKMRVILPESISVRIWRYGVFEEDVAFLILSVLRRGDTFVDVGSHFGFFSMLAGEIVGAGGVVVSLEPMPVQRAVLEENMLCHSAACEHHLIPAAAGAEPGRLIFKDFGILGSAFATSKDGRDPRFQVLGEVSVDVQTIDAVVQSLGLSDLRLIKIDAENAEYEVIQGSLQTIRELRPAIILETGDNGNEASATRRVVDFILAQGYEPLEFRDWSVHRHAVRENYTYQNILLVPTEKAYEMVNVTCK